MLRSGERRMEAVVRRGTRTLESESGHLLLCPKSRVYARVLARQDASCRVVVAAEAGWRQYFPLVLIVRESGPPGISMSG